MKKMLHSVLITLLALGGAASLTAAPVVVNCLTPGSTYVEGKSIYGASGGSHQGSMTGGGTAEPFKIIRRLSVDPKTSLNEGFEKAAGLKGWPMTFGGFTAVFEDVPEPAKFSSRLEFQDGGTTRTDFINYNLYLESPKPIGPGLVYQYYVALLTEASRADLADLPAITQVAYVSGGKGKRRVIVHDSVSGNFYVSEASAEDSTGKIALKGTRWAKVNPANLAEVGKYEPATFTTVDYLGIYFDAGFCTNSKGLTAFGAVHNFYLSVLNYTLDKK
ncbi:MAG: hypothetical protein RL376_644 [Verrucomicrobiota bacterium]|jgi:hypothetical protein